MKKTLLLFIMTMMLTQLVSADVTTSSDTSILDITVLGTEPFPAQPGREVEITLRITNEGNKPASNTILEFADEYPFSPVEKTHELGVIAPGVSATKKVRAFIASGSPNGDIEVPIRVSPNNGVIWIEPELTIEVRESTAALAVTSAGTVPDAIAPGHEGTLEVRLRNDGSNTLTALELSLDAGDAPIVPSKGSNIKYISSLKPGQSTIVQFPIAAESDAESGNYAPELEVTYNDFSGSTTKTFDIGIKIFEEPSLLLNIESREVYTGSDLGNIVLSVANTGTSVLKFTTVKLLSGEGYELVDGTSSYLGDLDPDDFQTSEFKIKLNSGESEVILNTQVIFKDAFNKETIVEKPITLRVFGSQEAISLGLKPAPSFNGLFFGITFGSLFLIFWLAMIVDWKKNKNISKDKKGIWLAVLILSNVLGALIYFIWGRKKHD